MIHILQKCSLPHKSLVHTNFAFFKLQQPERKNKSTVEAEKPQNSASRTPPSKSVNQCSPF